MPLRHILLALLVVAIWGVNFTVMKMSVTALPPILAAALRFLFAAFPAVLFVPMPKVNWSRIVLFGLFFGFGLYAFLNFALFAGMGAGLSSVVLQVQAFFTMALAFFLLGERPRPIQIVGAVIAFSGILVIALERLEGSGLVSLALVVAAAMCWGVANIVSKRTRGADPMALTVWGAVVAMVPLFLLSFAVEGIETGWHAVLGADLFTWGIIAFLAYPATLLSLGIWNWLLRQHPASTVAPFSLLVPVTGPLSGWLMLGETVSGVELAGALLVVAGLVFPLLRRARTVA
ncbi:MAG: EamA family transporter [Alphaproteobacteria bacterium]|nr:EamA family transporter [Alphaproteobacteria bacterium]